MLGNASQLIWWEIRSGTAVSRPNKLFGGSVRNLLISLQAPKQRPNRLLGRRASQGVAIAVRELFHSCARKP